MILTISERGSSRKKLKLSSVVPLHFEFQKMKWGNTKNRRCIFIAY